MSGIATGESRPKVTPEKGVVFAVEQELARIISTLPEKPTVDKSAIIDDTGDVAGISFWVETARLLKLK
ncbi:MAG: hypothetical protein A2233_05455 [Candidatus Kerfeldbacteria bacterium RIFOXYA2_FULL_38_24]|nr:MAG: hypothetical protein A2233_05455 [Candidatus Kerfeldbacteria bacterium RIFOXYA2_FULL_38_24]